MKNRALVGAIILALGSAFFLSGAGAAGDKEINDAVAKIAAAIKKDDLPTAKKLAAALAEKVDVEEYMTALKPRKKGGLGVGAKPGLAAKDGIELTLIDLGRDAPTGGRLKKEAAAWEEMAYVIAAVAEISKAKAPKSDMGKKTKKDWNTWTNDMSEGAAKLAEAAKAKGAQDIKTAASKLNAACNSCHSVFR